LYFTIVLLTLISAFIISFVIITKNKEKSNISYDTDLRIAKKIHKELANEVFNILAFAETQNLSTSKNKARLLNSLDTIYSRTRNISQENNIVGTGIYFLTNLKVIISTFNIATIPILINDLDNINWSSIEKTKKIMLYRVLQESLVNIKKYTQSSLVVPSFKTNAGKIHLSYSDKGTGVPFKKNKFKQWTPKYEKPYS
jgi:glucose-6-phosphate-specific signal transduction histidine kinase